MRSSSLPFLLLFLLPVPLAADPEEAPPRLEIGPDDVLESDAWLVGTLDGQPLANLHNVVVRRPDGSRTSSNTMEMRLQRQIGPQVITLAMSSTDIEITDADGFLTGFHYDQEEAGSRTTAIGRVEGRRVVATIHRAGGTAEQVLELPDGVELKGEQASQEEFAGADAEVGDTETFHSVDLMEGELRLITIDAEVTEKLANGEIGLRLTMREMPSMPIRLRVDTEGNLLEMTFSIGPMTMRFTEAEEPSPLGGATLAMTGVVETAGPPPRAIGTNRFRMPAEAVGHLPEDAFQTLDGDVLTVVGRAGPSPLEDPEPFLEATPSIEIEAPELREWTASVLEGAPEAPAARAEILRQAVRAKLAPDLSRGNLSALEAFRAGAGDCTEHANLLCAALRIDGIPARVEVGFVYVAGLGGWGGHAWVAAYDRTEGGWIHLDAAYPNVTRSCYIKTASPTNREGNADALLDDGMGYVMGKTIEVLPPEGE